jgi:hypothetical protein
VGSSYHRVRNIGFLPLVTSEMLVTLLLDPLSAIAYGELFIFLIKWGCLALVAVVLLVGFILLLRLDGASTQEEPVQSIQEEPVPMRSEDYFHVIMVGIAVLIVFFVWIL